jgi:hypothetical protein
MPYSWIEIYLRFGGVCCLQVWLAACLTFSLTLKMEAAHFSEMLVNVYHITCHQILDLHRHHIFVVTALRSLKLTISMSCNVLQVEDTLEEFLKHFDIVLIDDQSMDVVSGLLDLVL